jgi:hypothetical protein
MRTCVVQALGLNLSPQNTPNLPSSLLCLKQCVGGPDMAFGSDAPDDFIICKIEIILVITY